MSYLKLSLSSEIKITLGKSNCYLRLMTVIYLLTAWLIIQSSLPFVIMLLFAVAGLIQLRSDFIYRSSCKAIKEIKLQNSRWLLIRYDDNELLFDEAEILIHNILFQLISFRAERKKKLIVVFNEQLSSHELRMLHLKTNKSGI